MKQVGFIVLKSQALMNFPDPLEREVLLSFQQAS